MNFNNIRPWEEAQHTRLGNRGACRGLGGQPTVFRLLLVQYEKSHAEPLYTNFTSPYSNLHCQAVLMNTFGLHITTVINCQDVRYCSNPWTSTSKCQRSTCSAPDNPGRSRVVTVGGTCHPTGCAASKHFRPGMVWILVLMRVLSPNCSAVCP